MTFAMYLNTNANTFILKKSTSTEYFTNIQKIYSNSIRIRTQNMITPGLTEFASSFADENAPVGPSSRARGYW